MELEGSSGVTHRKLKVNAYRSAHRLLRIANRKARKQGDALVAMAMMAKDEPEEEDDDKKEEERQERIEKNKEWRRRRELQRWESCGLEPPPSPKTVRENNRKIARKIEKQLCSELMCSNCRCHLTDEVWECVEGHPTCGDCFDKENMGKDVESYASNESGISSALGSVKSSINSRKSSFLSQKSVDSLKKGLSSSSVATLSSIETIASLRESLAEIASGSCDVKSWEKYKVNEIDFFLDTLEVRKDAIDFYTDYNNAFKSIFYNPDIEGLSLHDNSNDDLINNEYKDERSERVLKYMDRLKNQGALMALKETLTDIIDKEDEEIDPSWAKFRLEEIDFFLNTLNIRKDAITYYGDYHNGFRSIFEQFHDDDEKTSNNEEIESNNEDNEEDSDENVRKRITKCPVCKKFIISRNSLVENVAKLFFKRAE